MYWLSIVIFLNGDVVFGPLSEGWSPRLQPDYEICQERREYLEEHWVPWLIENGVATRAVVSCTRVNNTEENI